MTDPFERIDELVLALPPERWMLVGGLMVHAHALRAGIQHVRPTDDADLVVEIRAGSYSSASRALESLGYVRHEPLDHSAPFHRFSRPDGHIDLMAPEGARVRFAGRAVIAVPGSRSALGRTESHRTPSGSAIRVPDVASALSLKGAAYGTPSEDRSRHLQDAVTLFACADGTDLTISKSMRANINALIRGLDDVAAWTDADQPTRRRAARSILTIRPDWTVPSFVLGRSPR